VYDIFVDFLLPEPLIDTETCEKAETRFDNWIQHGKRWAKLIDRFGSGIQLLIPQDLTNDYRHGLRGRKRKIERVGSPGVMV
jgi:hypothetical protein